MNIIEFGDCRTIMKKWIDDGVRVQTCVTSPPFTINIGIIYDIKVDE